MARQALGFALDEVLVKLRSMWGTLDFPGSTGYSIDSSAVDWRY
jgi:hypothetical protein